MNGGASHGIIASSSDVASDAFLAGYDSYGFVLPSNKQTQLFASAIQTALACLARAE